MASIDIFAILASFEAKNTGILGKKIYGQKIHIKIKKLTNYPHFL
jgi:hypothetical protein